MTWEDSTSSSSRFWVETMRVAAIEVPTTASSGCTSRRTSSSVASRVNASTRACTASSMARVHEAACGTENQAPS